MSDQRHDYRKNAMDALMVAANCERVGYRKLADLHRNKAAIWFRVAAAQTPWVKPQVAA